MESPSTGASMRVIREISASCIFILCAASVGAQQLFSPAAPDLLRSAGPADSRSIYAVAILLEESTIRIDNSNRVIARHHLVYRVDSPKAVSAWGAVGIRWSPWHQKQPAIRARVVTPDGIEHLLDPKSLSDAPANNSRPEIFDDEREYSGPLPAVKVGAVVEEEETLED